MSYLMNCWYMVSWASDVKPGSIIAMQVAEKPLVIYRGTTGRLAALEDRCPHKLAPLSAGQVEEDDLRCMYHGLKFASDGKCIEVPTQKAVPSALCVRSYPVVEAHSAIWVWMGDLSRADAALIPPFRGIDDLNWNLLPGQTDYKASYRLLNENLLDLSHVLFVHRQSFGAGKRRSFDPGETLAMNQGSIERQPRGVRQIRVVESGPPPANLVSVIGDVVDSCSTTDFLVPGIFLMSSDHFKAGAIARAGGKRPPDSELLHRVFTCQAVTPMASRTSRYFFALGPWAQSPLTPEIFRDLGVRAFEEDRTMIEAQQRVIDLDPTVEPKLLAQDKLGAMFTRVIEGLISAD